MAPFPVDSSEGDGRGCAWLCAGGTPALPGSTHLMTSPHQGHHPAEAVWRRLSMEEVHLHSCLFVSIRGLSSLTEPFAKFARKRDLLSGRVVVPGKPMASQVQIPFEGVILQEHSAPISCPTPNFAKGSTISRFSSNDPPTRKGPDLPESAVVFTIQSKGPEHAFLTGSIDTS